MTAQKGRDFLLKIGDGATSETFNTVAGFQANTMTINNTPVDVTTKSNATFRQLGEGMGIRSMTVTGNGIYEATSFEQDLLNLAVSNSHNNFQLESPNDAVFEGEFMIASLERTGSFDGATTFSVTLESAGDVAVSALV